MGVIAQYDALNPTTSGNVTAPVMTALGGYYGKILVRGALWNLRAQYFRYRVRIEQFGDPYWVLTTSPPSQPPRETSFKCLVPIAIFAYLAL